MKRVFTSVILIVTCSNICSTHGKHLFKLFCLIVLFLFSTTTKAQTNLDTLESIKLYVDSVKSKINDMRCLDGHWILKQRYSELPSHERSCGIIIKTTAFLKKQKIDRIYIRRDDKICYYSEKRYKYEEYNPDSPPNLEVYFYNGKILEYKYLNRTKKLSEVDVKKIIKKGGSFGGINQIIQWE